MDLRDILDGVYSEQPIDPARPRIDNPGGETQLRTVLDRVYGSPDAPQEGLRTTPQAPSSPAPGAPQLVAGRANIQSEPGLVEGVAAAARKFFEAFVGPDRQATPTPVLTREQAEAMHPSQVTRLPYRGVFGAETAPEPEVVKSGGEVARALPGQFALGTAGAVNDVVGMTLPPLNEGEQQILRDAPGSPAAREIERRVQARTANDKTREMIDRAGQDLYTSTLPMSRTQQGVTSAARSAAPTLVGVGLGVVNPALGAAVGAGAGGVTQAAQSYNEVLKKTGDHQMASRVAIIDGIAEIAGEKIGLDALLRNGGRGFLPRLMNYLRAVGVEASEETATQIVQSVNAKLNHEPEKTLRSILDEVAVATIGGAVGGAVYGGGTTVAQIAADRGRAPAQETQDPVSEALKEIFPSPRDEGVTDAPDQATGPSGPLPERAGTAPYVPPEGGDRQRPAGERAEGEGGGERYSLPGRVQGAAQGEDVTIAQGVVPNRETAAAAEQYGLKVKRGTEDRFLGGKTTQDFEADVQRTLQATEASVGHPRDWMWYSDAAEPIREYARGDPARMERLVRIVAAMSQRTGVDQNARNAVAMAEAILQGKEPPLTVSKYATDNMMALASDPSKPFDVSQPGVGKKLQAFYRNLHDEVFGENRYPHDTTVDRHIGRFFFGKEKFTDNEYDYAQAVIQEATRRHNNRTGETRLPRQMQARIWGHQINLPEAERAKLENRPFAPDRATNFGPTFRGLEQQVTAEAVPSTSTEIGRAIAALPVERQRELTREAIPIIDGVLSDLGVDFARVQEGVGGYAGGAHPNAIISIAGRQLSTGLPMDHGSATQVARALAYVLKQDAVPWFRADPSLVNDPSATQGVRIAIEDDAAEGKVFEVLKGIFGEEAGYTRIGDDLYVLNFTSLSNDDFISRIGQHEIDLRRAGMSDAVRFGAETFYEQNDWTKDPTGRAILEAGTQGRPDLQARLRDRADSFESLARDFAGQGDLTLSQETGPRPAEEKVDRSKTEHPFYSELYRQIERGPKRASADQWLGYINGLAQKGVKADEVKWSGIKDLVELLKEANSGPVAREDLTKWLDTNGVQIRSSKRGGVPAKPVDVKLPEGFSYETYVVDDATWYRVKFEDRSAVGDTLSIAADNLSSNLRSVANGIEIEAEVGGPLNKTWFDDAKLKEVERLNQARARLDGWIDKHERENKTEEPEYNNYRPRPFGENYVEIAVTAPTKRAITEERSAAFLKRMGEKYHTRGAAAEDLAEWTDEEIAEFDRLRDAEASLEGKDEPRFTGAHYGGENVVGHIRADERTDSENNKVLFWIETQSDWGEQGADPKVGWRKPKLKELPKWVTITSRPLYSKAEVQARWIASEARSFKKELTRAFEDLPRLKAEQVSLWAAAAANHAAKIGNVSFPEMLGRDNHDMEDVGNDPTQFVNWARSVVPAFDDKSAREDFNETFNELAWDATIPEDKARELGSRMELAEGVKSRDIAERNALNALNRRSSKGVPPGPFVQKTESWASLLTKKVIDYAVSRGLSRVVLSTGDENVKNYPGLESMVSDVAWAKLKDGGHKVTIYLNEGGTKILVTDANDTVVDGDRRFIGSQLRNVIGKEGAEAVLRHEGADKLEGDRGVFSGRHLKIGGHGMRVFYDQMMPNIINGVLKKLGGGRVFQVGMPGELVPTELREWNDEFDRKTNPSKYAPEETQHFAFDITPEMADKVARGDVALFQKNVEKQAGMPIVGGTRKGYFEQAYKHSQPVKVTFENGDVIYDAVKGLNEGHALWRARDNWPGANVEAVTIEEVRKNDPESHKEIVRQRAYGTAQLTPERQLVYAALVSESAMSVGTPAPVKNIIEQRGKYNPTKRQKQVISEAIGRLVALGMPYKWVTGHGYGATARGAPGQYSLLDRDVFFRESFLNSTILNEPGMTRWLLLATAHENWHFIDHDPKGGPLLSAFATVGASRLAYTPGASDLVQTEEGDWDEKNVRESFGNPGDLMAEALDAYFDGPSEVQAYLAYPLAYFEPVKVENIQLEVSAQIASLYAANPDLVKRVMPRWYDVMKEVFSHETPADARAAIFQTLRAQAPARTDEGISARGAAQAESTRPDGGGAQDRSTGQRVGAVPPNPRQPGGGPNAGGRFDVADPTRWDELVRAFQDNRVDLKRLQEAILRNNPIPEEQDAFLKDEGRLSRTADKVETARRKVFTPLIEAIRAEKLTLDEVESFLHARHAPEANAQITRARQAAGQPATPGLSGMTNVAARRVIDDFRQAGKLDALRRIADKVDAIIEATRQIYVSAGLEKQSVIDAWKAIYRYYVPLHREGFGDLAPTTGRGYEIRGKESKRRVGSKLAVENILANVMAAHEAAIVRGEKNRVDQALWKLLEANPNPAFWRKGRPAIRETLDVDTGLPVRVPDMSYKNAENALVLKIGGEEKVIEFNRDNARAMELVKSLRNMRSHEMSWWVASWAKANRLLANLATSYNPVFWATNLVRDMGTVAFNLQSTPLKGQEAKFYASMPAALLGVRDELRGKGNSTWAALYREAKAAGAMTGWMNSFDSINERAESIVDFLRKAERSKYDPRELAEKMMQVIKDYNDVIEQSTRLVAYKLARDQGMSKDAAGSLAKNLTVNFNRKGNLSPSLGAFYMFFNANVQGTARMATGMMKSKRVWTYMAIAAGFGMALDLLNRMILADDDDDGENTYDKVNEDIKARALIVMRPGTDGKFWKVPLPYGFNFPFAFGRVMSEFATKRDYDAWQAAMALAKVAVEAWSPFGQAATPAQVLSPSLLDPVVYSMENRDWAGRPLYKEEQKGRGPEIPASERGLRTTPLWAKSLAREISSATDGKIEINPGIVASLVASYTSGLGTTISQTFDVAHRAATGEDIPLAAVPLVSRFAGEQTEGMKAGRFAQLKEKALEFEARVKRLEKEGKTQEARELEREKPHLRAFLNAYKTEMRSKSLTRLYREAEELELEDLSRAERIRATKDWEQRRGEVYSRILRATNQARP